jgi:hypothetical protein
VPLFNEPERWEYGINIDFVGKAVEAVSGKKLDAYLKDHIFTPADQDMRLPATSLPASKLTSSECRNWSRKKWQSNPDLSLIRKRRLRSLWQYAE